MGMMKNVFILLVEDNEDDVFFFQRAMKRAGIQAIIHNVPSGAEAIDYLAGLKKYANRAHHHLPHLVMLDILMPSVDGFQVLEWMRLQTNLKDIPVIVVSSSTNQAHVERAKNAGANGFVTKLAEAEPMGDALQKAYAWVQSRKGSFFDGRKEAKPKDK